MTKRDIFTRIRWLSGIKKPPVSERTHAFDGYSHRDDWTRGEMRTKESVQRTITHLRADRVGARAADGVRFGGQLDQTTGGFVLATWVGVVMIVVLPTTLIQLTPTPRNDTWIYALAVTTISGARYFWIIAMGRRRLYELSFWMFTYTFVGLAALVQMRLGVTPVTSPRVDFTLNETAMAIVIVGILAFLAGLTVPAAPLGFVRSPITANGVTLGGAVAVAFFALAVDAYYVAIVGVDTFFTNRYELAGAVGSAWGNQGVSVQALPLIAMASLLVAFLALVKYIAQTRSREWPLFALTATVGIALALTTNPLTGARVFFGTAAMAIAAVFGLFSTPKRFRVMAVLWLLIFLIVYPVVQGLRTPDRQLSSISPAESLTSPDFDALAEINNTVLFVDRYGTTRGMQAAGVLLFWVPRQIWPEKPNDTAILLAESRGYGFTNISAPLWAELFVNGGWPLIVVGMLLIGMAVKHLDNNIEESLQRARAPSILGCFLPFYFAILMRGSLLQAMGFLSVALATTVFVTRWQRRAA